jgi:hypothetical protein
MTRTRLRQIHAELRKAEALADFKTTTEEEIKEIIGLADHHLIAKEKANKRLEAHRERVRKNREKLKDKPVPPRKWLGKAKRKVGYNSLTPKDHKTLEDVLLTRPDAKACLERRIANLPAGKIDPDAARHFAPQLKAKKAPK